jgi:hypothetical protein
LQLVERKRKSNSLTIVGYQLKPCRFFMKLQGCFVLTPVGSGGHRQSWRLSLVLFLVRIFPALLEISKEQLFSLQDEIPFMTFYLTDNALFFSMHCQGIGICHYRCVFSQKPECIALVR